MLETYGAIMVKTSVLRLPQMYFVMQINFKFYCEVSIWLGLAGTATQTLPTVHTAQQMHGRDLWPNSGQNPQPTWVICVGRGF